MGEAKTIRKLWLARLLKRSSDGIIQNDHHHDAGAIGPLLFRQACLMGLEGIVSKRRDSTYKAGPSGHWIKVKNPKSPAILRAKESSGKPSSENHPWRNARDGRPRRVGLLLRLQVQPLGK